MKKTSIATGHCYHETMFGVRRVDDLREQADGKTEVLYTVLAARQEQQYDYKTGRMQPVVGTSSRCELPSFANWARVDVPAAEVDALVLRLRAQRMRLTPGERLFMDSVAREIHGAPPETSHIGTHVTFEAAERNSVRGLARKGLLEVVGNDASGGEVRLLALGDGYLRFKALEGVDEALSSDEAPQEASADAAAPGLDPS